MPWYVTMAHARHVRPKALSTDDASLSHAVQKAQVFSKHPSITPIFRVIPTCVGRIVPRLFLFHFFVAVRGKSQKQQQPGATKIGLTIWTFIVSCNRGIRGGRRSNLLSLAPFMATKRRSLCTSTGEVPTGMIPGKERAELVDDT